MYEAEIRNSNMKKNVCLESRENYVTNLSAICVRVRRSYGMLYMTTRLKFLCPTAEQIFSQEKA